MKTSRLALTIILSILFLCIGLHAFAEDAPLRYQKGDKINDFTFTTYYGESVTLSEVLKEKEAVLINIWATWCGPCRNEFPFLEEAYKQYADRVEVIALSCESTDDAATLADFAAQYGLTFKIGQDSVGFLNALGVNSIPTSFIVDRFGTICFVESGSQPDVDSFTRLFDAFVGDDYSESILLDGVPAMKPTVASSSADDISVAVEAAATNPEDAYIWPMVVTEKDGRNVVASSNGGYPSTVASVNVYVDAEVGDAIVVTFKTSTEAACDMLSIAVNGKVKKVFGGVHDWMTYAIPVESNGKQQLALSYMKNQVGDGGEDTVWIDRVTVASGAEALSALAANLVYPVADENTLAVTNPEAREIVISDESGILYANFGPAKYYIINGEEASFSATLTNSFDPEGAFFYCDYDGSITPAVDGMTSENYIVIGGVDSVETTGYTYTGMCLYCDANGSDVKCVVYFKDEANLNRFVNANHLGTWTYADAAQSNASALAGKNTESTYFLKCVDQDGGPVSGAMLQVCDATTCQVFTTDANGVCEFTAAPCVWEVHVLMAPEGYTADSNGIVLAPVDGGEMVFLFTKK